MYTVQIKINIQAENCTQVTVEISWINHYKAQYLCKLQLCYLINKQTSEHLRQGPKVKFAIHNVFRLQVVCTYAL